jgi:PAS domain S-box-containing protein
LSPSFAARTGRTVAEFMQAGRPGGPQPVDDADWRALRAELQARRPFRDRLSLYRCTDGTQLAVVASGNPVHDAQGCFVGWRGVSRNVTPERAAQQTQARVQNLLDRLVQMSPDALCVARLNDGAILLANPCFLQMAGLHRRPGHRPQCHAAGPVARPRGTAAPAAGRAAGRPCARPAHHRAHRRRAGARPMLMTAARFDWDGEPVAVITTRDIGEIEHARAEADAILEHASVGIALVRGHRFERVNPPFEAVFGRAPGSLAGQPTSVLFPAARDHATIMRRSGRAQADDGPIDIECEAARPDGTRLLVRLRARPVDAERPHEQGAIWVAEDITERRRAETELAEAANQRQERLPGDHEPRDPHAAQRRAGPGAADAGRQSLAAAAAP